MGFCSESRCLLGVTRWCASPLAQCVQVNELVFLAARPGRVFRSITLDERFAV